MRCALVADIHANLAAFTAVLEDIARRGEIEEMWCLGDIVGYGPDPNQCLELLRRCKHVSVCGNHDLAAIGKLDLRRFNPDAAFAARWTEKQLSREHIDYITGLPQVIEKDGFTLVHGSPREPIWEYLVSTNSARENFAHFSSRFCLVGHSHIPLIFKQDENGNCSSIPFSTNIGQVLTKSRMIINPGGVGQPRDGDPRASYAVYDSESSVVRLYRVTYDIKATQMKMVKNNLPMRLVFRLEHGL
jgi:diadenosine tetraphosphatase ApaH/serine/threonine PP2A family protein phosphatase